MENHSLMRREFVAADVGVKGFNPSCSQARSTPTARAAWGGPMSLTLYYHPLSSFCQKVLVALYENATPFTPHLVDLSDTTQRAKFVELWPIGKFPVLHDAARDRLIPESSILIEYLSQHYPGPVRLIPDDPETALRVRAADRFIDLHIHLPLQAIVGDSLRPEGHHDPHGVKDARAKLQTGLGLLDREIATSTWGAGEAFSLADCAAAPALFYANEIVPLGTTHRNLASYLQRLLARPSFARAVSEAQPYFHMFPKEKLA
jgi:glutathione S-transferase